MLVGFAVETGTPAELVAEAKAKLGRKGADLIIGNRAEDAFDKGTNQVWIVSADQEPLHIETSAKKVIARAILDQIVTRLRQAPVCELTH
jgi:phosphopantothenoylcysteine synthetase/decarboxylase